MQKFIKSINTYGTKITNMEQVANMPEFPSEGSIGVINDIIVVKVSDIY